ncbi:MAG TPA: hypothetical protein VNB54_14265, partial [Alphaproteobacteria bacterium]|nr:hypothetical protein [Alphaproteobacteria bacterium]
VSSCQLICGIIATASFLAASADLPFRGEMPATSLNSPDLRSLPSLAPEPWARPGTASAAAGYIEATVVDCAATGFLSLTNDETKVSTRMEQVFFFASLSPPCIVFNVLRPTSTSLWCFSGAVELVAIGVQ